MITLTAKINLLSGDNKALSFGLTNLSSNNISCDYGAIMGVKKQVSNPAIIGASKIGDGSTIAGDKVDFFMGNQLANENYFEKPYEIEVQSKKEIKSLTVAFDTFNQRHPNRIKVEETKQQVQTKTENKAFAGVGSIVDVTWDYNLNAYDCRIRIVVYFENLSEYKDFSVAKVYYATSSELVDHDGNTAYLSNITWGIDEVVGLVFYGHFIDKNIREKGEQYSFSVNADISYSIVTGCEYNDIGVFVDDDAIWTLMLPTPVYGVRLTIDNWNTENYPLVISGIYTEIAIEIDRRNMISVESEILDRSDLKLPSFGILSNKGNIKFIDTTGEIKDYAEELLLESGLKCEIRLTNTLVKGASEVIGVFETDQWDYDNDSKVVNVSLKDNLVEWQDINVEAISYNPQDFQHKPFSELYWKLYSITSKKYNIASPEELDETTWNILRSTYITYPLLKSGSLWAQWTKLCEVCQLHIYKDRTGKIMCKYNGGN